MMLIGARASFCAGHRLPQHNSIHGHSYEVWAYTDQQCDVEVFQQDLAKACRQLDHQMLNDILPEPTMENIARHISALVGGLVKINIVRPVEGLACEWRLE